MSKVAVIKCENYDLNEVKTSIKKALDLIGGIDSFVKENDRVLLKPNLLAAETAERSVTTHPVVFEAIVSILQEKKVSISYGDSPGVGRGNNVALKAGIDEIANKLGVKYYRGDDIVDKNMKKSFDLFKKVCDSGNMEGCNNLAVMYNNGDGGIKKDLKLAKDLFDKACKSGYQPSCDNIKKVFN